MSSMRMFLLQYVLYRIVGKSEFAKQPFLSLPRMASSEEEVSSGQAREEAASDDVEPPVASETPPETEDGAPDSDSEEGAGAGLELRNVLARRRRKSMEDGSTSSPRFRPRNEAEEQGKGGGELMGRLQAQRRRSKAGEAFNSVRDFYSREEAERLSSAAQEIEHVGQAPSATVPTPSRRPSYSSVDALYNQRVQRELTPAYALTRLREAYPDLGCFGPSACMPVALGPLLTRPCESRSGPRGAHTAVLPVGAPRPLHEGPGVGGRFPRYRTRRHGHRPGPRQRGAREGPIPAHGYRGKRLYASAGCPFAPPFTGAVPPWPQTWTCTISCSWRRWGSWRAAGGSRTLLPAESKAIGHASSPHPWRTLALQTLEAAQVRARVPRPAAASA